MKYKFDGIITSIENHEIPFQVSDGVVVFSLQSKSILPYKNHGVLLSGVTKNNRLIYLLINRFYELGFRDYEEDGKEMIRYAPLQGIVEACAVLDSGTIDDVNSLGFYSLLIPKITGHIISETLNDKNTSWAEIKKPFGKYVLNNREYKLSIGFIENEPHYSGQLLELKSECKFDINSIKESYWIIKKFLSFLFQKANVPIDNIYLRNNEKNIGQLFVEHLEKNKISFLGIRCIQTNALNGKADCLLQLLADKKLYLRHIPMFKDEEKAYTPGRFLMALAGLENTLNLMNIHVMHSKKHKKAIDNAIDKLRSIASETTGDEREIYRFIIKQLRRNEAFKSKIFASLEEDREYVSNFFPLNILGDNSSVAEDLSEVRNKLAHGDLDADLGLKADYQMHFLMLYILYLQLKMIGFDKNSASEIVTQILFRH